jgi:hypothetical protein
VTAAFETSFATSDDLIQAAINGIRGERRRNRLQRKFNENPNKVRDRLVGRCTECSTDDCDSLAEFLDAGAVQAIDPETLKRWIEIIKVLLPLILAFL